MYCSREYQPTTRFIQQYEKSISLFFLFWNIIIAYKVYNIWIMCLSGSVLLLEDFEVSQPTVLT